MKIFYTTMLLFLVTLASFSQVFAKENNIKNLEKYQSRIAEINCYDDDGVTRPRPLEESYGTGSVVALDGKVGVLTNSHVIKNKAGKPYDVCEITIYSKKFNRFTGGINWRVKASQFDINEKYDTAVISSKELRASFEYQDTGIRYMKLVEKWYKNLPPIQFCRNKSKIGSNIAVIGYPAILGIASSENTPVVTTGIVSGYRKPYLITSAKIEHGNSGGVAINIDEDCIAGIPTAAYVGEIDSYGAIIESQYLGPKDKIFQLK